MQDVRMYSTLACPYCQHAKALLKQRGVEAIDDVRVDLDPAQRAKMMELTGRRTVPQIFIGDTHVMLPDPLLIHPHHVPVVKAWHCELNVGSANIATSQPWLIN